MYQKCVLVAATAFLSMIVPASAADHSRPIGDSNVSMVASSDATMRDHTDFDGWCAGMRMSSTTKSLPHASTG